MPGIGGAVRYFGNALNFRLMKPTHFLVVILLTMYGIAGCASSAYRQRPEKTFRLEGFVFDAGRREPVAGVYVRDDFNAARTDTNGHFALRLPASAFRKGSQAVVHTVFYNGSATITADTTQPVEILLRRNAYRFKPNDCQQLADSARIPRYTSGALESVPGTQFAFLLQDTTYRQRHKLRSVAFRVGQNGLPRQPFRIRIYQYDILVEVPPGQDILRENILACPEKEGIITYDLSSYDIEVSGTGFYLALEPVLSSNKFYCTSAVVGYTPTGPILRPPCARPDIRTWEYVIGKGWHRATAVENCWPLYESALSVEVEPAPSQPTKH